MSTRSSDSHRLTCNALDRSRSAGRFVALTIVFCLAALPAAAQISLSTSLIAGGGDRSSSAGGCFTLDGSLGESGAGTASGGNFVLSSGYWAGIDSRSRDSLFNTGFEGCQ